MKDMSSEKFPRIPRPNENVVNGWGTLINKLGREGSEPIIREAFTVKAEGEGVTSDEGTGTGDEAGLGARPECR